MDISDQFRNLEQQVRVGNLSFVEVYTSLCQLLNSLHNADFYVPADIIQSVLFILSHVTQFIANDREYREYVDLLCDFNEEIGWHILPPKDDITRIVRTLCLHSNDVSTREVSIRGVYCLRTYQHFTDAQKRIIAGFVCEDYRCNSIETVRMVTDIFITESLNLVEMIPLESILYVFHALEFIGQLSYPEIFQLAKIFIDVYSAETQEGPLNIAFLTLFQDLYYVGKHMIHASDTQLVEGKTLFFFNLLFNNYPDLLYHMYRIPNNIVLALLSMIYEHVQQSPEVLRTTHVIRTDFLKILDNFLEQPRHPQYLNQMCTRPELIGNEVVDAITSEQITDVIHRFTRDESMEEDGAASPSQPSYADNEEDIIALEQEDNQMVVPVLSESDKIPISPEEVDMSPRMTMDQFLQDAQLNCPIALDTLNEPIIIPSGHTFTMESLEGMPYNNLQCPITRIPFHSSEVRPNYLVNDILIAIQLFHGQDEQQEELKSTLCNLLVCHMTGEPLTNPVVGIDGYTYNLHNVPLSYRGLEGRRRAPFEHVYRNLWIEPLLCICNPEGLEKYAPQIWRKCR
jgi:hypothetical protein